MEDRKNIIDKVSSKPSKPNKKENIKSVIHSKETGVTSTPLTKKLKEDKTID